jgi:hypothetical protein
METVPVVYLLTSVGGARLVALAATRWGLRPDPALRAGAIVVLLACAGADAWTASVHRARWHAHVAPAWAVISAIPGPAIVFVRYRAGWNLAFGLVQNPVAAGTARVWVVRDLGPRNDALRALAPARVTYTYDTASGRLERMP